MSNPSNDVSPTIQEPQRVSENADSDTQVVDEELDKILNTLVTDVEVARYGLETGSHNMEAHVSKIDRYQAETEQAIKQLLGQQLVKELSQVLTQSKQYDAGLPMKIYNRITRIEAQYNLNPKERSE